MWGKEALPATASIVLAVTAVAAGLVAVVAEGASLAVAPRALDALHAERVDVTDALEIVSTAIELAPVALPARGTPEAPVELTAAMTPARTEIPGRSWTLTATVAERDAESAPQGQWDVVLFLNGEERGAVRLAQNASDALLVEGARVTWALGAEKPILRQSVVIAFPVAPDTGYRLRSEVDATLAPSWRGVGGEIEGETNPTLAGVVGATLPITISNGDGNPHRLLVKDAGGATVAGPTEIIADLNDEETLFWVPASSGAFTYLCDFHPDTMEGAIDVPNTEASSWQPNSKS